MAIELVASSGNRIAKASLLPKRGALLTKLVLDIGDRSVDVLWTDNELTDDETGWPRGGMPLMFPFAGRVFYNGQPFQYELDGKLYNMPLHGFIYGLPWQVVKQSTNSVILAVRAGVRTQELFPYDFSMQCQFSLFLDRLHVKITVQNHGVLSAADRTGLRREMPVAFGLHPYLRVPQQHAGSKSTVYLQTSAQAQIAVTPAGGAGKAAAIEPAKDQRGHRLDAPLFSNLILGQHQRPEVSFIDASTHTKITIGWDKPEHIRYVVLWSEDGQGFHCLEPWMGLPDAVSTGAGVCWLPPGETLDLGFTIGVETAQG